MGRHTDVYDRLTKHGVEEKAVALRDVIGELGVLPLDHVWRKDARRVWAEQSPRPDVSWVPKKRGNSHAGSRSAPRVSIVDHIVR